MGTLSEIFFMSPPREDWHLRGRANFRSAAGTEVDPHLARTQWLMLARAIEARGGTVVALESTGANLTGMPYAAECGHLCTTSEGAATFLLPTMAADHRRDERVHWSRLAATMGIATVAGPDAVWEAQGDVAVFREVELLFYGGRTQRAGLESVRPHFSPGHLTIETREPAFHGNMAVLPLHAVDVLVVCPEVLGDGAMDALTARFGAASLLEVSEADIRAYATNGLPMGRDLLAPTVTPDQVLDRYAALGMNIVRIPLTELCDKAGGASRCLVSRGWLDLEAHPIPPEVRLEQVAARIEGARG